MLTRELIQDDMEDPQEMEPTTTLHNFSGRDRTVLPPTGRSGGNGGNGGRPGRGGDDACAFVSVNLSAYQDGELDPDSLKLIVSHLAHCPHCAAELDALQAIDETLEREWRDSAPLPSSSQFACSIDAIMDALPGETAAMPAYAPKRVHAKVRWTRFATGVAGLFAFGSLLWSSYRMGYEQGLQNGASRNPGSMPSRSGSSVMPASLFFPDVPPSRSSAHYASSRSTPETSLRSVELP